MTSAESTTPTESMVTIEQRGSVVRADSIETATDLAAALWLMENEGKPSWQRDPLPEGVTADDVLAAIRRRDARLALNRSAIQAYAHDLCKPLPKQQFLCPVMDCQRVSDRPGTCDKCLAAIAAGKFDGPRWERILIWSVVVVTVIAIGATVGRWGGLW